MTDEEANAVLVKFRGTIQHHTDMIVTAETPTGSSKGPQKTGFRCLGSCVHVAFDGGHYVITCSHVAKQDGLWFCGPKPLDKKMIPDGAHHLTRNLTEVERDDGLDIVVLSGDMSLDAIGKKSYEMATSSTLGCRKVQEEIGTAGGVHSLNSLS